MKFLTVVKRSPIVFPLACVAVTAMVFISEGSYWQSATTLNKLGAMAAVPVSIQDLQWSILDAQAAKRAYVSSGDPAQLQALAEAERTVKASFKVLDEHYADAPGPRSVLQQMHVLSERNLAPMRDIRVLSAELLSHEVGNVARGRVDLNLTLLLGRIGVAGLSALSLLTLFLVLRQSTVIDRQRREQQEQVQAALDRLELEVVQRTAELSELTLHLQTAREDERNRLARDLHDELGALLTSAKLDAARIKSRLSALPTAAPEALERLAHLVETLNSGIALKRRIVEDLRPSALSTLGLPATLEILAREFGQSSGLALHCELQPVRLSATADLVVYRLVQEATTNIGKYARAGNVWITLAPQQGRVAVTVRDDGIGFDTDAPLQSAHGLMGMRFRVKAEGGTLEIESAPGKGCLITASLPESA